MEKILINLFSKSLKESDFERYSIEFKEQYEVYSYYFDTKEMFPEIVEVIIKQIEEQDSIDIKNSQIIFQTNVVDLCYFSAKAYSEILDGVILVNDSLEYLSEESREFDFINTIILNNYTGYRLKKVFMRNSTEIQMNDFMYLLQKNMLTKIDDFKKFKLENSVKANMNYKYIWSKGEYTTSYNLTSIKIIQIESNTNKVSFELNEFTESLSVFYLIKVILETNIVPENQSAALKNYLCENVRKLGGSDELAQYILRYIESKELNFENHLSYLNICMEINYKETLIYAYDYINRNYNKLDKGKIYGYIINSLFYASRYHQIVNDQLVKDRLSIMKKLNEYWSKKIKLPKFAKRKENHIAIVVGQFLSINHAPTKWAIDYANALKKYNPELKIKIFVEDFACYSPNEVTWQNSFSSADSKDMAMEHKKQLLDGIEVYYSDSTLIRRNRLSKDFNAIVDFQPALVFKMGSKYNLTTDLLYKYFPIISCTMGGSEDCEFVDVFTGGYKEETVYESYRALKLTNQEYIYHTIGLQEQKMVEEKIRENIGLLETDFVLVTVGNRLDSEISEEFIAQMENILKLNDDYKWLIVGLKSNKLIEESETLKSKTIFIEYETNLYDLYRICDVYINPIRKAGGNSAAMAMQAGLPVITTDPTCDVATFVGKENCIAVEKFVNETQRLRTDKLYYADKSKEMQEKIKTDFSFKKTVRDLEVIFNRAIQKFEIR